MKTLNDIFVECHTDKAADCHDYASMYEMFFEPIRFNNDVSLLEIGIFEGASLRAWRKYFENGKISGIDLRGNYEYLIEEGVHATYIMDQSNREQLTKFANEHLDEFSIILDDGSHECDHQILTFEILFPVLKSGGYYICEDLLCAADKTRWAKNANSLEYFQKLVMDVNMGLKISPNHLCSNKATEAKKYDNLTYLEENILWAFYSTGLCIIKKM
jgi:hypothetical protein